MRFNSSRPDNHIFGKPLMPYVSVTMSWEETKRYYKEATEETNVSNQPIHNEILTKLGEILNA